jgi:hypothetical protein
MLFLSLSLALPHSIPDMVCVISTPFMRESSDCWMKYHSFHAPMAGRSWLVGQNVTEAASVVFGVERAAHGTKVRYHHHHTSIVVQINLKYLGYAESPDSIYNL